MFKTLLDLRFLVLPKSKPSQVPLSLFLKLELFIFLAKQFTQAKQWNQANLGYYDPHLNKKVYSVSSMISVGKNIYY